MIQGLPEKKTSTTEDSARTPAATQPKLTDLYEQEVIDFAAGRLDRGDSEAEVTEALRGHDFRYEEARQLVRAVAKERPDRPSTKGRDTRKQAMTTDETIVAEIQAGRRGILFGVAWIVGSFLVGVATILAGIGSGPGMLVSILGVWGVMQIREGFKRISAAKRLRGKN